MGVFARAVPWGKEGREWQAEASGEVAAVVSSAENRFLGENLRAEDFSGRR